MHTYTTKDCVEILTSKNFKDNKLIHPKFRNRCGLIKVYAPWCGHCQKMMKMIRLMGKELSKHRFYTGVLNGVEESSKAAMEALQVKYFPTLFLVKPNGELEEYTKDRKLEDMLSEICRFSVKHSAKGSDTKTISKQSGTKKPKKKSKRTRSTKPKLL